MKYLLFLILSLGIGISANAQSSDVTHAQVSSCDTCACFKVTFKENPTTGFKWQLQSYDQSTFSLMKDQSMAPDSKLMGAPGQHVFYFEKKEATNCPQSTTLCFRHARPWESANSGECTEITIHFSEKKRIKN